MDLKYAVKNDNNWKFETVDSLDDVGASSSIYLDNGNNPHISYIKTGDESALKYAFLSDGEWNKEIIDNTGGSNPSLVLDKYDTPHIVYGLNLDGLLMYASLSNEVNKIITDDYNENSDENSENNVLDEEDGTGEQTPGFELIIVLSALFIMVLFRKLRGI